MNYTVNNPEQRSWSDTTAELYLIIWYSKDRDEASGPSHHLTTQILTEISLQPRKMYEDYSRI